MYTLYANASNNTPSSTVISSVWYEESNTQKYPL